MCLNAMDVSRICCLSKVFSNMQATYNHQSNSKNVYLSDSALVYKELLAINYDSFPLFKS